MNKKTIIICAFISLFANSLLFSQEVSVELSLTWDKGRDLFTDDTLASNPYLHITYRNNSQEKIYFFNNTGCHNQMPPAIMSMPMYNYGRRLTGEEAAKLYQNSTLIEEMHYVRIRLFSSHAQWEAIYDIAAFDTPTIEDKEGDIINDYLSYIYDYYQRKYYSKKLYHRSLQYDFYDTPLYIIENNRDRFVFLDVGETHTETYNLIAFNKIGGTFIFNINPTEMIDYIKKHKYDSESEKYNKEKVDLPKNVDGYSLYSGAFKTNTITVKFEGSEE